MVWLTKLWGYAGSTWAENWVAPEGDYHDSTLEDKIYIELINLNTPWYIYLSAENKYILTSTLPSISGAYKTYGGLYEEEKENLNTECYYFEKKE
jgi:hypothetical protein